MAMLTFLDRFLDVPEEKVTYLTRPTLIDRILDKMFLGLIPKSITPNDITGFRLASIPFIAVFLILGWYTTGTILFLFAAFSDALDGAMARTQRKVTTWGTFYDPIADKLLIGTVATIVISQYMSPYLALTIVLLEILLVSLAYVRYKGHIVPAKSMGKLKMILQCVGVIFLLFFIVFHAPWLLIAAKYTLYGAVAFAVLSLTILRSI